MTRLTLGCLFSDRVEALLDGRVGVEGVDLDIRFLEAQALFRAVLADMPFDVAELSMASHIAAVGAGRRDWMALPVFPSRSFRHSNVYVRSDRIRRPEDLKGCRIGLIDYQQTAALWVRGLLADDHGVDRRSVEWVAAGLHAPVLTDRGVLSLPPGIRVSRSGSTLDGLLRAGAVDAVISPTAPHCFTEGVPHVARLWPDARAAELAWWRRERLFPVMHVLVMRRALAAERPDLPAAIAAAFDRALELARADVGVRDYPKVALPWLADHASRVARDTGADLWAAGLEPNRPVLDRMLDHAVADGLTPRRLCLEELFS